MRVAGHITGKLSEFFVDSKLTSIVILGCLICGLWAVLSTPREENPQITMPGALVQVVLPGAMPSEVEQTVLKPLEAIVNQIPGVDHTEGAASDSVARLTVRFKVGEEKEASLNKLYDRVYSGRHLLPAAASVPMIVSADADDVAAVTVTLASEKYDDFALRRIANAMRDELLSMADVSTTTVEGGRSREFTVAIDPERLQSFGATLDSVRMAVAASNVAAPLGSVVENGLEQKVRLANGIEGVDELRSLPIGVFSGRTLRLGDVAEITDGPAARRTMTTRFAYGRSDADNYVLTGGREMNAVTLAVAKKKNTNAVEVADQVIERVERMKATVPEGVHVVVTRNDGERANDAVNLLLEHLGIALVSVVAVTWLFLGRRPALIVGLSIPLILAITLTITKIDGLTINRLSLYALIIALGLLVDDAIVVVENVVRHFGLGSKESKPVQVVRAADEIGSPTMMATFTVMLVFYSLVPTLTGMPKQYFHPVGVTVPVAIFASLFIAYSVVPWMCRHWIPMSHEKGGEPPKEEPILIARVYDAVAGRVIGYPVRELVLMLALAASFAASCVLPAWQFIRPEGPAGEPSAFGVQMGFLPKDNKNTFNVTVKMKEGTALEVTDRAVRDVAAVVSRIPEVVNYQSWTGEGGIDDFNSLLKGAGEKGSNIGAVRVNFTNKDTGRRSTIEIASELREALRPVAAAWPGSTIQVVEDPPGPPLVATVLTEVYGRDPKELRVISDSIEAEFRKTYDMVEIVRNAEADVVERRLALLVGHDGAVEDDDVGHRHPVAVVLAHEGRHDLGLRGHERLAPDAELREARTVAEMAPAPDHREVDAGDGARNGDRHDVRVGVAARRLDRLLVLHGRERRDAVPVEGGLLEGPGLGCLPHAPFIILDDVARAPLEKGGGALDVLRVVILRDGAHAGRRAAADLAEQARAVTVREDGVLAGPQAEDLLHDLDRLAHGRPVGIGPEEAGLAVDAAAIVGEPRKRLGTEPQIGITLVVPEEDVVLRAQRLDEVVLKKKGLRLAARDGGLESGDLAHHDRDARGEPRGIAEVGRDALL
jgi:multidrug efflux pump subunit AcrB